MPARPDVHERTLADRGVRKELGAYYTPIDVVDGLLDLVLDPILAERRVQGVDAVAAVRVLDPACGTGNFLVAATERIARVLAELGEDPEVAKARAVRCVRGIEIDPGTARACRAALRLVHPDGGGRTIVQGDAMLDAGLVPGAAFDLVVGNPPFLSQMASSTARTRAAAGALRDRFGPAVGPYTDPAAVFLLVALDAARAEGGVIALIEPVSVLSVRDARRVRATLLKHAALEALWVAQQPVFDADVEVCAPVLRRGSTTVTTEILRGRAFSPGPVEPTPAANAVSWSPLLAAAQDVPERTLATAGTLGDLADATADFRDQYYGLAGSIVDRLEGPGPRLVTSGLIDPGHLIWSERSCRFNKVTYRSPRVDLERLAPPIRAWAERRLVPKVLVATQTRVIEAVVDEAGDLLPSVPVVSVTARRSGADDLWRIGALLCAPPIALVAARRHLGAARSATALRLSASDLLALPLPADHAAWERAAAWFAETSAATSDDGGRQRRVLLRRSAAAMGEAFGLAADDPLTEWWERRLPQTRVSAAPRPAAHPAS